MSPITKLRAGSQLREGSVDTTLLKDSSVIQQDMALGSFTGSVFADRSIATLKLEDGAKLSFNDGSTVATANMRMGGFKITGLGSGAEPGDAINKSQLDSLAASLTAFEWQPSVLAILLTPVGLAPVLGDRYLIRGNGEWVWAGHNNVIAEWMGADWRYIIPAVGTVVNVDGVGDKFYLWDGILWQEKWLEVTTASTGLVKSGFDIQLDPLAAGAGLRFTGGVLSIDQGNGMVVSVDGIAVDAGIVAGKIPQYHTNGFLGIGRVDPESMLHVSGNAMVEGSGTLLGLASVSAPDAAHGTLYYNSADKRLHFRTSASEQIIVAEEGIKIGEAPASATDGVRTRFALAFTPIGNSEAVYLNGIRETRGMSYTVQGNEIVFADAPYANHVLRVDYRHIVLI